MIFIQKKQYLSKSLKYLYKNYTQRHLQTNKQTDQLYALKRVYSSLGKSDFVLGVRYLPLTSIIHEKK
jgi:hypothetical protein